MADDRQLRDELEKVQSEVLRLRKALDQPQGLHADVRARIEGLRRSRAQQQTRRGGARPQAEAVEVQLRGGVAENETLQAELDALLASEGGLVDAAVRS